MWKWMYNFCESIERRNVKWLVQVAERLVQHRARQHQVETVEAAGHPAHIIAVLSVREPARNFVITDVRMNVLDARHLAVMIAKPDAKMTVSMRVWISALIVQWVVGILALHCVQTIARADAVVDVVAVDMLAQMIAADVAALVMAFVQDVMISALHRVKNLVQAVVDAAVAEIPVGRNVIQPA